MNWNKCFEILRSNLWENETERSVAVPQKYTGNKSHPQRSISR